MAFVRDLFIFLSKKTWLILIVLFHSIQVGNISVGYVTETQTKVSIEAAIAYEQLRNAGAMICGSFKELGYDDEQDWKQSKLLKMLPDPEAIIKSCVMHDPEGYGRIPCKPAMFSVKRFLTQSSVCYVIDNLVSFKTFSPRHVYYGGSPPVLWSVTFNQSMNKLLENAKGDGVRLEIYLFPSGDQFQSISGSSATHDMELKVKNGKEKVKQGSFALTYQPTVFKRLKSPKDTHCKDYSATEGPDSREQCIHDCIREGIRNKTELFKGSRVPLLFHLEDNDTSHQNSTIYNDEAYNEGKVTENLDGILNKCIDQQCKAKDCTEERFPVKVSSSSDSRAIKIEVRAANHPVLEVITEPKMSHMEYINEIANTVSFWWGFSPREILKEHFPWLMFYGEMAVCFLGIGAISIVGVEDQPAVDAPAAAPAAAPAGDAETGELEMASREEPVAGPSGAANTEPKGRFQSTGFIHTTRGTCIDHVEDQARSNSKMLNAAAEERAKMKDEVKTLKQELDEKLAKLNNGWKKFAEKCKSKVNKVKEECVINIEEAKIEMKHSIAELNDGFVKKINEQVDKTNENIENLSEAYAKLALKNQKLTERCQVIQERISNLELKMKTEKDNEASSLKVPVAESVILPLIQPCLDRIEKLEQAKQESAILPLIQPYVDRIEKLDQAKQSGEARIAVLEQSNQQYRERIAVLEQSALRQENQPSIQQYVDRIATLEQSAQESQSSIQQYVDRIATLEQSALIQENQPSMQACLERIAQLEASASNSCGVDTRIQLLQESFLRLSRAIATMSMQPLPPTV